tara:strand:- start:504 stop:773 length:270 start_codon:yes stop_codon:yes gene_type:complete
MVKECLCIETLEYLVEFKNGTCHTRVECVDCHRFIKWKPQPSKNFKLWFGKYKDKTLSEVPVSYLNWYKENGNNEKVLNKINNYLTSYS